MSNNKTVKWKRWTRASYAVFNSLHREVVIGVLSATMLQSVGLMASQHKYAKCSAGNAVTADAARQLDTGTDDTDTLSIALGAVDVVGTRVPLLQEQSPRMVTVLQAADVRAAAVQSINDLLEYAVGVDVRQRGEMGVQTDISVRGGTHDQITLLLNGINISSPHTGHLSADFPVSMDDIECIEVVEGPAARVFGTSAFTGVINIVTKSQGNSLHLRGGAYGYAGADGRLSIGNDRMQTSLSGGYSRSDGATPNSYFSATRLFWQGTIALGKGTSSTFKGDREGLSSPFKGDRGGLISAQVGYSRKPYGANTFYGAASDDQWEETERMMAAVKGDFSVKRVHILPQLYWNRWNDHYQWHRGVSPAGENRHHVDVYGAAVNSWTEWALGKTSLGAEMRIDGISSTNLGDHHRTNLSAFLEHDLLLSDWTISLGVLMNRNTALDQRWRFYPGIDVSWRPLHGAQASLLRLFASWNMALRMPTYTDLYYSGSNIEGSHDLMPEKTNDVSVGARSMLKGMTVQAQLFYSHKTDMIDWVVYDRETYDSDGNRTAQTSWTFRSGNFQLDSYGAEVQLTLSPADLFGWQTHTSALRQVAISYAYIGEDISYPEKIQLSKYAMEYLRHKVVVQADGTILRNRRGETLSLSAAWRWQDRTGTGNAPYALLDARLSWDGLLNRSGSVRYSLYADCSNILNKQYYDYNIVRQPGRWLKGGLRLSF